MLSLIIGLNTLLLSPTAHAQAPDPEQEDSTQATISKMYSDLEILKRIKITGYFQFNWQNADSSGIEYYGGNFPGGVDKRFSIRRGRIKFTYDKGPGMLVFQTDMTEKGLRVVEAYARISETKINWFSLQAGIFNRPFGYEIGLSSSVRETPERGRMSPALFPNERDLGAEVIIQGPKGGNWNWLKLEAGMFTGVGSENANVGINDFDKKKDFIAHLSANRNNKKENIKYGFGVSMYSGGWIFLNDSDYEKTTGADGVKGFKVNIVDPYDYSKRQYYGVDGQIQIDLTPGALTLRAEYIFGDQPGTLKSNRSPGDAPTAPVFVHQRNFDGAYFYLVQNITRLKLQAMIKYDWYDPNKEVKGDEIGKKSTSTDVETTTSTDLRYDTWGFGLAYLFNSNTKILLYYDYIKNETSANLSGYTTDLHDNVFTARLQYKF